MVQLQRFNLHTKLNHDFHTSCRSGERRKTVGLSDGLAWTARSGNGGQQMKTLQTVLDMRGSNPLSRSKIKK